MDEKHIDLLVSITGLDKEFITNSIKTEEGTTIILNQFKEKNKVFKKEDFELREKNSKATFNAEYLIELTDLAKTQKLPSNLYNAVANNIISAQNKKLGVDLGIELDDYSNYEAFKKAVEEKLTKVDDTQLKKDFEAQAQTIKDFEVKFSDQETNHKSEINKTKIDIAYATAFSKFQQNIDYEKEEELTSRITVADSVFKSNFVADIQDGKEIVKDKEGNVLKNDTTKEPLTFDAIFDTEISKYVPMKKERSTSDRNTGDAKDLDGVTVTREMIDKKIESGEIKPQSKEHIALETKFVDQE